MIPDFGSGFVILLRLVAVLAFLVIFFAGYLVWQAIFGSTYWELCAKMDTDKAKVQCMESINE